MGAGRRLAYSTTGHEAPHYSAVGGMVGMASGQGGGWHIVPQAISSAVGGMVRHGSVAGRRLGLSITGGGFRLTLSIIGHEVVEWRM